MLSSIALFDSGGEIIALRQYRKDFNLASLENFRVTTIATSEIASPINLIDGISFFHICSNDIYYVAAVIGDVDAARIFEFLLKMPSLIEKTLNIQRIDDKNIREYIVDIVEILDEMVDFGYPRQTEAEALRILTCHTKPEVIQNLKTGVPLPTGSVPWIPMNIDHKNNSVYVNIVEKVSMFITTDGTALNKCINGLISMSSKTIEPSECTIVFNTKAAIFDVVSEQNATSECMQFDNIVFHQCVRLNKFLSNKEISFVMPEGPFELMSYTKSKNVQELFKIVPNVEKISQNKLKIVINVQATYDKSIKATKFKLVIPLPQNTANVELQAAEKSDTKFDELMNAVIWRNDDFVGGTSSQITIITQYLSATYITSSATKLNQPIHAEFQIPRLSASGFSMKKFKVNKEPSPNLYIRYATEAGKFQIMMQSPNE